MFKRALYLLLTPSLFLAVASTAHATSTIDLVWSGSGSGSTGATSGDLLTLGIVVNADAEGFTGILLYLHFDGAALDYVSSTACPGGCAGMSSAGTVVSLMSTDGYVGLSAFAPLSTMPTNESFILGSIDFIASGHTGSVNEFIALGASSAGPVSCSRRTVRTSLVPAL